MIGKKLAHFEVVEQIGRGGMGEVFRARDTRLGRDVALKVLPPEFGSDRERLARFQREARVLAQLQHDNVAAIYGLEEAEGRPLLVMELVDGEELSALLSRGAVPPAKVVQTARQLAAGLEAAHEKGIVHRDLKPANVMLTPEGKVKILDFGLARAFAGEVVAEENGASASAPTLTQALTGAGTILGTAAYMSPEQARGMAVDRRTDIWAFGVILVEMLTGKQLFAGDTATDILAAVLRKEPDWEALPDDEPLLAHLCRRCLEKDPQLRLRDIGEARVALEGNASSMSSIIGAPVPLETSKSAGTARRGRVGRAVLVAGLAAVAALVAGLALGRGPLAHSPLPERLVRSEISLPAGVAPHLNPAMPGPLQVSPDGRHLAFSGQDSTGQIWLYLRTLDSYETRRLTGTRGAIYPFWAADSRSLAFFADGRMQTVDLDGGPVLTVCEASNGKGGTWNADGTILFAPSHASAIFRVPATGGEPVEVTKLDRNGGQRSHRFPCWLPDGEHFVYLAWHEQQRTGPSTFVHLAHMDGSDDRALLASETNALFAQGHLIYAAGNNLMARPFSVAELAFTGAAMPLESDVLVLNAAHVGVFSASQGGVLALQRGSGRYGLASHHWLQPEGERSPPVGDVGQTLGFALSPDGRRMALALADTLLGTYDIWVHDFQRSLSTRFTFDSETEAWPVWSPDGGWVAYGTNRLGRYAILRKPLTGGSPPDTVATGSGSLIPTDWSPDGRTITYCTSDSLGDWSLMSVDVEGDGRSRPLRDSRFDDLYGCYSPNGRWLAYGSAETGTQEIFVESVNAGGGRWRVSASSGAWPRWSPQGDRIYYITLGGQLMAAEVQDDGDALQLGRTEIVAEDVPTSYLYNTFDIDDATGRLLVQRQARLEQNTDLTLVTGWGRMLQRGDSSP